MSQMKNTKTAKKGEETTVAKIKDITCSPKTKMGNKGKQSSNSSLSAPNRIAYENPTRCCEYLRRRRCSQSPRFFFFPRPPPAFAPLSVDLVRVLWRRAGDLCCLPLRYPPLRHESQKQSVSNGWNKVADDRKSLRGGRRCRGT